MTSVPYPIAYLRDHLTRAVIALVPVALCTGSSALDGPLDSAGAIAVVGVAILTYGTPHLFPYLGGIALYRHQVNAMVNLVENLADHIGPRFRDGRTLRFHSHLMPPSRSAPIVATRFSSMISHDAGLRERALGDLLPGLADNLPDGSRSRLKSMLSIPRFPASCWSEVAALSCADLEELGLHDAQRRRVCAVALIEWGAAQGLGDVDVDPAGHVGCAP